MDRRPEEKNRRADSSLLCRVFEAVRKGNINTVSALMTEHGPQRILSMEKREETVLQAAVEKGQKKMLKFLLEQAADQINKTLANGDTLLHWAIQGRQPLEGIVLELLNCGADPNIPDRNGDTLLHRAIRGGKSLEGLVVVLLQFGAKPHIPDQRQNSAFHAAAVQSGIRVFSMLLTKVNRMGQVDAVDENGQTPLHYAASKNNEQHVDWLLFVGADPHKKDKDMKVPGDVTTSPQVRKLLTVYWKSIPDAIIPMQGDWSVTLTETPCTLSRSAEQPPDPVTPPVLAFRCLQGQRGKAVTERFYMKSFEVEEMCLEVFEYRCSQPCVLKVTVGVKGYCIDSRRSTLFFKCIDDVDDVVEEVRLARLHEGKTSCIIHVQRSGMLALVHRRQHVVAKARVGRDECYIRPDNLRGLELHVSGDTFHGQQEIMIKEEELRQSCYRNIGRITNTQPKGCERQKDPGEVSPITPISSLYTIVNSGNERPRKSMEMRIPLATRSNERVVALIRKQADDRGDNQQGQGATPPAAVPPPSPGNPPVSVNQGPPTASGSEGAGPEWRLIDRTSMDRERTTVSVALPNFGIVVVVEVKQGVKDSKVIQAIQQDYAAHNKEEIFIFAVAKRCAKSVEVMVCSISARLYEAAVAKLKESGCTNLGEPTVIYTLSREIFSLQLQGNFQDKYMNEARTLEYQVGGRLNHMTFVLLKKKEGEPAEGAVVVSRYTSCTSAYSPFGVIRLDLTPFFLQDFHQSSDDACGIGANAADARQATGQATGFSFHDNHGKDIVLSDNMQTAERMSDGYNGIVVSRDYMAENRVYEVQVEEIDTRQQSDSTYLGAVTQSPDTVALPLDSWLLGCAIVVRPDCIFINGTETKTKAAEKLQNVRAGSRIGVGVDTRRHLHVLLDGEDLGVAAPRTTFEHPCHAFFDLGHYLKKVRALPVRKVNW